MKRICTALIPLFFCSVTYLQTTIPQAQTLFIYNFSKLIEWPSNYRTGSFVIGVLDAAEVAEALETYTKGKKVGVQDISVIRYNGPGDIATCHILFVPFTRTRQMAEILGTLNGKSTLIITEKNGALNEGAAINFIVVQNKIKFELKPENAGKLGIKFSSKLQELAAQSM